MNKSHTSTDELAGPIVEILAIALADGRPRLILPFLARPWTVVVRPAEHPQAAARRALAEIGLVPEVLHSTSWRQEGGRLVLTYVALLDEGGARNLTSTPVVRQGLALGTATAAPDRVTPGQVVEHALRHLAWLIDHDPAIRLALRMDWARALDHYRSSLVEEAV